jgi:hypothetical protein
LASMFRVAPVPRLSTLTRISLSLRPSALAVGGFWLLVGLGKCPLHLVEVVAEASGGDAEIGDFAARPPVR